VLWLSVSDNTFNDIRSNVTGSCRIHALNTEITTRYLALTISSLLRRLLRQAFKPHLYAARYYEQTIVRGTVMLALQHAFVLRDGLVVRDLNFSIWQRPTVHLAINHFAAVSMPWWRIRTITVTISMTNWNTTMHVYNQVIRLCTQSRYSIIPSSTLDFDCTRTVFLVLSHPNYVH
jgi:hypothetical protein